VLEEGVEEVPGVEEVSGVVPSVEDGVVLGTGVLPVVLLPEEVVGRLITP